ncbi:hypothetical protein KO465_00285 [Candidatus Micrarchaeota archaeon]|nr:hypothetical protein [Candidatus Micrarchaeota archaeon]
MADLLQWYVWVGIAMMITLSIGTILYLISRFFKSSELEFWAKGFVTDTISTAILVFLVIGFMSLLILSGMLFAYWNEYMSNPGDIPSTLTISGSIDDAPGEIYQKIISRSEITIQTAEEKAFFQKIQPHNYAVYLMRRWSNTMSRVYHRVFATYFLIAFVQNSSIVANNATPVGWFATGPMSSVAELMKFFLDVLDTVMFAQYMFIELVIYGEFIARFFIPLGIILRVIPTTRGIGAMLLAFGLGFGFILPVTYVFIWSTMSSVAPDNFMMFLLNHPKAQFIETQLKEIMSDCDISFKDYFTALSTLAHAFEFIVVLKDYLTSMMIVILYRSLVFPIVSLTFLLTFIRSAGLLLGADLSEIAKGLAKLI